MQYKCHYCTQTAAEGKRHSKVVADAKRELNLPWQNIHECVYACNDQEKMSLVREVIWGVKCDREDFIRRVFKRLLGPRLIGIVYPRWPRG